MNAHAQIPLQAVESSQIAALGHDPETSTLAIQFKSWKGETTSTYHYSNVSAEEFEAFRTAPSIGRHFGQHIKPHVDRYPFVRVETAPARAA